VFDSTDNVILCLYAFSVICIASNTKMLKIVIQRYVCRCLYFASKSQVLHHYIYFGKFDHILWILDAYIMINGGS